jgi:hypothetical protein
VCACVCVCVCVCMCVCFAGDGFVMCMIFCCDFIVYFKFVVAFGAQRLQEAYP